MKAVREKAGRVAVAAFAALSSSPLGTYFARLDGDAWRVVDVPDANAF